MAMDKINGSPLIQSGILDRFQGTNKADQNKVTKEAEAGANLTQDKPKPADTAEISETAHKLMALRQTVDTGRAALEQMPDVRQDRIDEVRQRMAEGFYQSTEVHEQVAAKLGAVFKGIDEI